MSKRLNKKSLTRKVLDELIGSLDDFFTTGFNPIGVAKFGGVQELKRVQYLRGKKLEAQNRRRKKQALERLQHQEYIRLKQKGHELFFQLTDKGVQHALKDKLLNNKKKLPHGQRCYVSFDIPEHSRHVRDELRWLLKRAEFIKIHQSLWSSDNNVVDELVELIKAFNVQDWIHIFVGESRTKLNVNRKK
ncbi:MAG: hypothetical protein ABIH21_05525 [Patescibacteria group bacterium]